MPPEFSSLAKVPHGVPPIPIGTILSLVFIIGIGTAIIFLGVVAPAVGEQNVKTFFDRSKEINSLFEDLNKPIKPPAKPVCGNGICEVGENISNCLQDCFVCNSNGICEPALGENQNSCPADCFTSSGSGAGGGGSGGGGGGSGGSGGGGGGGNTSGGEPPAPYCGDGSCNGNETCSTCIPDCGSCPPVCGNSIREGNEACDENDLNGQTCTSKGFTGGTLSCKSDCSDFNTVGCFNNPICGNNIREGNEICDGNDLNGKNCLLVPGGFSGGTLACKNDCSGFDTSGCILEGNTFYLDAVNGNDQTGDGSLLQPWKTIAKAQSIVQGGDTVILMDGNYGAFVENPLAANRTAFVTYRAANRLRAIFDSITINCSPECNAYLRFDGVWVNVPENAPGYNNGAIYSSGASYLQIINSKLSSHYTYKTGEAIYFVESSGQQPHDLLVRNTEVTHLVSGIRFHGNNITIQDNNVYHISSTAVGALAGYGARDVLVENNHLHEMRMYPEEPFYEYWADAHASSVSVRGERFTIRNNHIHDTRLGIQLYKNDGAVPWEIRDIDIENNLMYDVNHPFSIYNPGRILGPIIIRRNTLIGIHNPDWQNSSDPLKYRLLQNLLVDFGEDDLYNGLGSFIQDNLIVQGIIVGNRVGENYNDPTAQWVATNNLIYVRGWAQGLMEPSNKIIYEEINAGRLPQDYIDTGLFVNPIYTMTHGLTCEPNGPCDFRPKTGSLACNMSTTGSYVGAFPCV